MRYVTYDSTVGLRVDGTEAFQLHHGFGLLSLLTTTLQVPIKEIHHLHHRQHERKHSVRQRTSSVVVYKVTHRWVPVCGTTPGLG